jgi:hypothetical protein
MPEGHEMTFPLLSVSFIIIALWIINSEFFFGENSLLKKEVSSNMLERTLWKISKNHHIFGKQIMKSLRFLEDLGRFLDLFF